MSDRQEFIMVRLHCDNSQIVAVDSISSVRRIDDVTTIFRKGLARLALAKGVTVGDVKELLKNERF